MKKILSSLALFLCFLVPVDVNAAASGTTTVSTGATSAGTLDLTIPATFTLPNVTYDKTSGIYGYGVFGNLTVSDGRGTGDGWSLSVSSSPITEAGGKGLTLPAGALTLYKPTAVSTPGSTSNAPAITTTAHAAIDSAPYTIVTAAAGKGMGVWNITMDGIEVYADQYTPIIDKVNYPGSPTPYNATLTWTLSTTP